MPILSCNDKRTNLFPYYILLLFVITTLLLVRPAFAVITLGGGTHTETDVQILDYLYGGSDSSQPGGQQTAPINLTVTTQYSPQNIFAGVAGGSYVANNPNTILGDVILNISNTQATDFIMGGSGMFGNNVVPTIISGSIYLTAANCASPFISGNSFSHNGVYTAGSIHMNLSNVEANSVYGAGINLGCGQNDTNVGGDVNITINNSKINHRLVLGSAAYHSAIAGNITLNMTSSIADTIFGTQGGTIFGNLTLNIEEGTRVKFIYPTDSGSIHGITTINLTKAEVLNTIRLGSIGPTTTGPFILNINESKVDAIRCGSRHQAGIVTSAIINLHSGLVNFIHLGPNRGLTQSAILNISGGEVNAIKLGPSANPGARLNSGIINVSGGKINTISLSKDNIIDYSAIHFCPGRTSRVYSKIGGPRSLDLVNILKDSRTQWGEKGEQFTLNTKHLYMSGEVYTAPGSTLLLTVHNTLTADGGFFNPKGLTSSTSTPVISLIGTPESSLIIRSPLSFQLSCSPELLGANNIPIVTATGVFANPELFTKRNTHGLIWSDTVFNPTDNSWYLTNIRPSEDFHAFSAAREASNWLRQQHIWNIQKRSNDLLGHGVEGLWCNIQGGQEKLDAAIGEAKMPWVMVSVGYDIVDTLESLDDLKAVCGFGVGVSEGHDKWSTINKTKNDIRMGLIAVYLSLLHENGIYGTATAQLASNRTTTKCTGFNKIYKWTETIPTGAVELGWQYTFENGLRVMPRGKIIVEQLSKRHFKLPYENDTAILEKSLVTTTSVGLAGQYEMHIGAPIQVQATVDWLKGVTGDFAAKSRLLKKTFKDKNDTSVIRTSLGVSAQLKENFDIHMDAFSDFGQDKGFGGKLGATYRF